MADKAIHMVYLSALGIAMLAVALLVSAQVMTARTAAPSQAGAAHRVTDHLYLTIENFAQANPQGWPQYVPGNFTVPANATVYVTITNYDDGADTLPAQYAKTSGTVGGTEQVNGQVVSQTDPSRISHTFTIAAINLNVFIPAATDIGKAGVVKPSVVTFVVHTGKAGTYTWQCFAPCGTGSAGWGGPMALNNFMRGTMTVG